MTSTWTTDQRLELQLMGTLFDLWLWQWEFCIQGLEELLVSVWIKKHSGMLSVQNIRHSNDSGIPPLFHDRSLEKIVFRRTVVNNLHSLNMPVSLCLYSRKQLSIYVAFNANRIHSHRKIHTNAPNLSPLCLQSLRVKSRESLKQTTFAVYSIGIGVFFRFLYKAWGIKMHSSHFHQETEYGKSLVGNGPSLACAGAGC